MKFKFILLFLCASFFYTFQSFAQTVKVSGTVINSNENVPVNKAVVALLSPADSILVTFTRTDADGRFQLSAPKGQYIMMTSQPYFADLLEDVNLDADKNFSSIKLLSKATLLQEVIVKTGTPFRIKGDTTIYTADSFKVSANANVEELLKKLPGIQVDKDGKIKAMGENVAKVLVDGEEFFGDDPGMTIKNLRADGVKEVQVFDKKSEQSEFTGIDDGQTKKTINLKLKEEAKKGYFGKVDLAGGPMEHIDNRYNSNLMFSSFKGKRKFSAFLLNGNTGQDGLSWQDEQKFGSSEGISIMDDGGGIMIFQGGSSDDEPYVDPQNGYMYNLNGGLLYSNKWNDKNSLNLTPKFNQQIYDNFKKTYVRTQIGDSTMNQNASENSHVNRYNVKVRGIWDMKIDSANTLKITANTNLYHTESQTASNSITTGGNGTLKNTSDKNVISKSDKAALSGNLIYKHKFKKDRRTISLTADWKQLNSDGFNILSSVNQSYFNGQPAGGQVLNQTKNYKTTTSSLTGNVVYTEPLGKELSLELGYQVNFNNGTNDQITMGYTPATQKYDRPIDSLTNNFKQRIVQNIPSAKINFANKKWKVNVGLGLGFTDFLLEDITMNKNYNRNYTNFFPNANASYTYKANKTIRLSYQGSTTQPTINQLQPLRNNDDYYNQYKGNPDLKPSFRNNLSLSHSSYNFLTNIWNYQALNISFTNNAITNNRVVNVDSGKTIIQPINTDGSLMVSFYGGVGFKLKKLDIQVTLQPNLSYFKFTDVINNKKSVSKTITPGMTLSLSKSKANKYDFNIWNSFTYNSNTTEQNNQKTDYYTNQFNFSGTVYIHKVWSIVTDYNYNFQQKTFGSDEDISFHILNAKLQRTFKDNEFTAYISANDILNQNIGLTRSFSGNTYREVSNERLQRYFMVGFTWNFKNKSATAK